MLMFMSFHTSACKSGDPIFYSCACLPHRAACWQCAQGWIIPSWHTCAWGRPAPHPHPLVFESCACFKWPHMDTLSATKDGSSNHKLARRGAATTPHPTSSKPHVHASHHHTIACGTELRSTPCYVQAAHACLK